MKKIVYFAMALLAAAFIGLTAIYAEPLRLHILANSNSQEDQHIKMIVRDAILEQTHEEFSSVVTEVQAEERVQKNIESILAEVNRILKENGFSYTATAELGEYAFPDREYAERTYPAGDYRALRILLGEGKGDNWWCVLYPPLCMNHYDAEETEIRSYFADWLKGVFHA